MRLLPLLFITFCSHISFSQEVKKDTTIEIKTSSLSMKIEQNKISTIFQLYYWNINEVVYQEMTRNKLKSDKVMIEICIDTTCRVENVRIKTKGKTNSLNVEVEKICYELLTIIKAKNLSSYFASYNDCQNFNLPLKIENEN